MPFTNSPNMGLPVPQVSVEPGPQFATDVNQALLILDSHSHNPGSGVPIGSQGISLQSDLSFNINNATALRSVRFISTTASSGTDVGCIYVKGTDLYYNDLSANIVRITQNGGLSSTGIFFTNISTTAIISANTASPATSGFIRMGNNTDFVSWRNSANNADNKFYFDSSDVFNVVGPNYIIKLPTPPTTAQVMIMNPVGTIVTAPITPTIQTFTGGAGTYNTPANAKYIKVTLVGGGGGGSAISGTGSDGSSGTDSSFGGTLLIGGGGQGGLRLNDTGGLGGGFSFSVGPLILKSFRGAAGNPSVVGTNSFGGSGGASFFGGNGQGSSSVGYAAVANTGSGGGGAGETGGFSGKYGNGGGAGGFLEAIINAPTASYSYSVGSSGAPGIVNVAGGAGSVGYILVEEYYS